ncbi:MAG: hypothetical protein ACREMY_26325, partial [bacterium]
LSVLRRQVEINRHTGRRTSRMQSSPQKRDGGIAMLRLIAIVLISGLSILPSLAENIPDVSRADRTAIKRAFGDKVAAMIFSNGLAKLRADMLKQSGANIPGYDCKGERLSALVEALPYPIEKDVYSWIERYLIDCSPRAQRNIMVIVENDHARAIELLPGETKADPRLQRDALKGAQAMAAANNPKGCERIWTTDTRAVEPYKDNKTPWVERWSFDLCGKTAAVEMSFLPGGGTGTSYTAKLVK